MGWLAVSATASLLAAGAVWGDERPSLLVLGLRHELNEAKWREKPLGIGIHARLAQIYADSRAFTLIEEKDLADSLREAVGGYWLQERSAAELRDLEALHRTAAADWIAHGSLDYVGVTRDRVTGLVGGRRWAYRVRLRLCLHGPRGKRLCRDGQGHSVTRVMGAIVEYRGDEIAFDQAGPAEAVDRALVDAFNRLMPAWERLQ